MCGIVGSIGKLLDDDKANEFAKKIQHRGPDEIFTWKGDNSNLIVTRLAIQDLAKQQQPFFSEDQKIVCIFNGEIYNHRELRQQLEKSGHQFKSKAGDGEVIVHLYEEFGTKCFEQLEGMFAICLIDFNRQTCFLARDFFGIKPLYYENNQDGLFFCSEIGIFFDRGIIHIDQESMEDYLTQGHLTSPNSILVNVKQVEPGNFVSYNLETQTLTRKSWFSQAQSLPEKKLNLDEARILLHEHLERAVIAQIPEEVSFGVFLSGGLDSSLVALLAAKNSISPIHTFSVEYPEIADGGKSADKYWSRFVADLIDSEHHITKITSDDLVIDFAEIVSATGDPFAGVFTSFFLSKYARKYVKVCLTGDGADELFGGYINSRISSVMDQKLPELDQETLDFMAIPNNLYEKISKTEYEYQRRELLNSFYSHETPHISKLSSFGNRQVHQFHVDNRCDETGYQDISKFRKSLAWDLFNTLPNNVLYYADRFSMHSSLEIRPPFLDRKIFDLSMQVPDSFLIGQNISKKLLKQLALSFFPEEMVNRKKEGFISPLDFWLRKPLKSWAYDQIQDTHPSLSIFVDMGYIDNLMEKLSSNLGDYRLTRDLWKIIVLNQWLKGVTKRTGTMNLK